MKKENNPLLPRDFIAWYAELRF